MIYFLLFIKLLMAIKRASIYVCLILTGWHNRTSIYTPKVGIYACIISSISAPYGAADAGEPVGGVCHDQVDLL